VCDGNPPLPERPRSQAAATAGTHPVEVQPPSNITIRYSGHHRQADDLISQLIRVSSAPRRLIVISSDHAVQRTARKRRCLVLTSEEFLGQLADDANLKSLVADKPASKPIASGMTQDQIDRWVKVFNLNEDLIDIPSLAPVDIAKSAKPGAALPHQQIPERIATSLNKPAPKPVLPDDLIEQAERMVEQDQETTQDPNKAGDS
jgi:hypothetical protein